MQLRSILLKSLLCLKFFVCADKLEYVLNWNVCGFTPFYLIFPKLLDTA